MQLQWDGKVGPASIIGGIGSLSVLVTLGIVWGTTSAKIDDAASKAAEARSATVEIAKESVRRDQRIAIQAEKLAAIDTSIKFIVPAIQRIEAKIDGGQK